MFFSFSVFRFLYLELPMCRLQKLLRLVCRTPRRQDELVNHDLMFEFIHFPRSLVVLLAAAGGEKQTFDRLSSFFFFFSRCIPSLWLSRPPLQPVEQTQIFTVGAVVEWAPRDWQEEAANQERAWPLGVVGWKRKVWIGACLAASCRIVVVFSGNNLKQKVVFNNTFYI